MDTHGIPDSVPDNQLEGKVTEIFNQINAKINAFDTEDCHCMYGYVEENDYCPLC